MIVQLRGIDENLNPYPQFDMKFPYLNVILVCYFHGSNNAQLRNDVFKAIRERGQQFTKMTKDVSAKKAMDIVSVPQNTMNLIDTAELIVQGVVVSANPEILENMQQQWVVNINKRRLFKGALKNDNVTIYTDSPTIRFKGSFVGKQFIMFLDLKFRDPDTYSLMAAEPVTAELASMIEQRLGVNK
jgi:hypothetical protein